MSNNIMDENLLTLLEELSLRTSFTEDGENNHPVSDNGNKYVSSGYASQTSNFSSPSYEQLDNGAAEEDLDLKNAVSSLFHELNTPNSNRDTQSTSAKPAEPAAYDKTKLLVALLGNIDLVKCAIKRINQLVSLGKKMEQIYRMYYIDPNVPLDLEEISGLITAFSDLYNSESYVREVNVSRVYQAYCKKLIDIYNKRQSSQQSPTQFGDEQMIS